MVRIEFIDRLGWAQDGMERWNVKYAAGGGKNILKKILDKEFFFISKQTPFAIDGK